MTAIGTNVSSTQCVYSLRCYINPVQSTQQLVLGNTSVDGFTADLSEIQNKTVAPSTTDSAFALATLFPVMTAPVWVSVTEPQSAANIGYKITTVSGSGRMGIAPAGSWVYLADGTTALPTIYITNSNSSQTLYIQIAVVSQ